MRRALLATFLGCVPWLSSCIGPCPEFDEEDEVLITLPTGELQGVGVTGGGAEIPIDRNAPISMSFDREAGTGTLRYVDLDGIEQEVPLQVSAVEERSSTEE